MNLFYDVAESGRELYLHETTASLSDKPEKVHL